VTIRLRRTKPSARHEKRALGILRGDYHKVTKRRQVDVEGAVSLLSIPRSTTLNETRQRGTGVTLVARALRHRSGGRSGKGGGPVALLGRKT
jgi:hypothetical protein